jgi:hypothetical protein
MNVSEEIQRKLELYAFGHGGGHETFRTQRNKIGRRGRASECDQQAEYPHKWQLPFCQVTWKGLRRHRFSLI